MAYDCSFLVRTRRREAATLVLGFSAGAVVAAWPVVRHIDTLLPHLWPDTLFNAWILAWGADRLLHGLSGFWNAPFFHPYADTLAFSEHLLGISILTAPLQWLTGKPILVQNVAFLASYVLAGCAMYLLVRDLTRSRLAAVVSSVAFAFLPFRTFDTRVQVLMYGWTPLALWALHRYFRTGYRSALACFAAAFLLQGLSHGYAFYSAAAAVLAVLAVYVTDWRRRRRLIELAATALLMLAALWPVIDAYRRVRNEHGLYRNPAGMVAARATNYMPVWRPPTRDAQTRLSPGFALSALAVVGVCATARGSRRQAGMAYVAVGSVGFVLSLGPEPSVGDRIMTGPYGWLLEVVPGLDALREPDRFAILVYVSLAVLAGLGTRWIFDHVPRRAAAALCLAFGVTTFFEGYAPSRTTFEGYVYAQPPERSPARLEMPPSVQAAHDWLAEAPPGAVIELPFSHSWEPHDMWREGLYVYGTLVHGHPIVTGYSGYFPPLFRFLQSTPFVREVDDEVLRGLRALGVRYVLIHEELYSDTALARATVGAIRAAPEQLESVVGIGATTVARLRPATVERRTEPPPGASPIPLLPSQLSASHGTGRLPLALDGDGGTRWMSEQPQTGNEHIDLRFAQPTAVVHVVLAMETRSFHDYPRRLVIESSADGRAFDVLYDDTIVPQFMLGGVEDAYYVEIDVSLPPVEARVLRLRQTGRHDRFYWSINELRLWQQSGP